MNNTFAQQRINPLYIIAAVVSILLSFWISVRESVINPDAICYLLSAQEIGSTGISGAMHLCGQAKWPLYSALIYGIVQLSHFSFENAAYLIDGIFSLITVLTFMMIVRELGGTHRALWLAAAVILTAHDFNISREYIVRDHGFWAFYLASILCLLRYFQKPQWRSALAWSASIILATLFRIEGAAFLMLTPFAALCCMNYSWRKRMSLFLSLNLLTIVACIGIGAWLLLHPQESLNKLGRLAEIPNQVSDGIALASEHYQSMKNGLAQHVLTSDSARDAGVVLCLLFAVWYIASIAGNLSFAYALLAIYAWRHKLMATAQRNQLLVLHGYLAVNIAVTFAFLLEHVFFSKRYLIALSLVLMLWVPFALNNLIEKRANIRYRIYLSVTAVLMLVATISSVVDFGYSKSYIHNAGDWVANNVPANAKLFVNDYQLMYYTQHFGNAIFTEQREPEAIMKMKWRKYDYLALRYSRRKGEKTTLAVKEIPLTPIQVFSNKRGDRVEIYKINTLRDYPEARIRGLSL